MVLGGRAVALKKQWSAAEFFGGGETKRDGRSFGGLLHHYVYECVGQALDAFCFLQVAIKRRVLRRLPVAPAGAAETAWRVVFAARWPAISALVSVAEVRSPRVYEVFMPGALSAYKRVSFCAARACRRSLFGHFEADAQATKFIVRGELPALFRITGRPRLETDFSRKHKRRRPSGRRRILLSGMAFRPESAIYDSQGDARQRLRAIAVDCSDAVDCRRIVLVLYLSAKSAMQGLPGIPDVKLYAPRGWTSDKAILHFQPCKLSGR